MAVPRWTGTTSGSAAVTTNFDTGAILANADTGYFEHSTVSVDDGLDQSGIAGPLTALHIAASFLGNIGNGFDPTITLSKQTPGYFKIPAALVKIGFHLGAGDVIPRGPGAGMLLLNLHTAAADIYVERTCPNSLFSDYGLPAVNLLTNNVSAKLQVAGGAVGLGALSSKETFTIDTIRCGASYVPAGAKEPMIIAGRGGTIENIFCLRGLMRLWSGFADGEGTGGMLLFEGSGGISGAYEIGAGHTMIYNATGTGTSVVVKAGGTLDLTQSDLARTINVTFEDGANILWNNDYATGTRTPSGKFKGGKGGGSGFGIVP